MKLIILLLVILFGCNSTGKYGVPFVEDCIILAKVHIDKADTYRCFCIDYSIKKKNFNKLFDKVKRQMSDHPRASEMLDYIEDNKKTILKKKEYILDGYYCRGYSAVSPRNREIVENWAEENRVKRIKCENNLDDW